MKIILFTILGGLIFLWAGVLAFLKWIEPIERKHIYGLGGYASLVMAVLLFLVLNTSMTQQKAALAETSSLLGEQVDNFRLRLGEITERLMGQIEEKAELTESEMEVRGDLKTERAEHALTQERLAETQSSLQSTERDRDRERRAHFSYKDSLNTERSLQAETRRRLETEQDQHDQTRNALGSTRRDLSKKDERLSQRAQEVKRLRGSLDEANKRAEETERKLLARLKSQGSQLDTHKEALILLQSSVDSIYRKVLKRPRVTIPSKK